MRLVCKLLEFLGYYEYTTGNLPRQYGKMQGEAVAGVLCFFEKRWEELLKFSRRTPRRLERWAARYGCKEHPKEILDFAKKGCHGGRYTCVNLQNDSTVEFRMFRGTLRASSFGPWLGRARQGKRMPPGLPTTPGGSSVSSNAPVLLII